MPTQVCEICGKEFEGRNRRRFCSRQCNAINLSRTKRRRVMLACKYCGTEFEVVPAIAERGRQFCSIECFEKYRQENGAKQTVPCSWCGNPLELYPCRMEQFEHHFCSRSCEAEWHKSLTGQKHPNWSQVRRRCKTCGKIFYRKRSHVKRFGGKYCSLSCAGKARVGERGSNWRGGRSRLPYIHNWHRVARRIRKRDSWTCRLCSNFGKDVHHIDYDRGHNTADNLITLCRSCHARTNTNRTFWQRTFAAWMEYSDGPRVD